MSGLYMHATYRRSIYAWDAEIQRRRPWTSSGPHVARGRGAEIGPPLIGTGGVARPPPDERRRWVQDAMKRLNKAPSRVLRHHRLGRQPQEIRADGTRHRGERCERALVDAERGAQEAIS